MILPRCANIPFSARNDVAGSGDDDEVKILDPASDFGGGDDDVGGGYELEANPASEFTSGLKIRLAKPPV